MEKLQTIIDSIPQLLIFFVPGFVTIVCFKFVTYTERNDNDNRVFLSSVVCSYLMYTITTIIIDKISRSQSLFIAVLLVEAIVAGFAVGFVWKSKRVQFVLSKCFSRNIVESSFVETWRNITAEQVWFVDLYLKEPKQIISGQVVNVYDPYKTPVIRVMCFSIYNQNGNLLEDQNDSDSFSLLINLSNINYYIESIEERKNPDDTSNN